MVFIMESVIIMPHSEITKGAISDQLLFLPETFGNSSVDDFDERIQPWVGLIETRCIHGDWQNRIYVYKSTKTKSFIWFISMGFINFACIKLYYGCS